MSRIASALCRFVLAATAVAGCTNDSDGPPTEVPLETLCTQTCAHRFDGPACVSEGLDLCIAVCPSIVANLPAGCEAVARASLDCEGTAAWMCDADGEPVLADADACTAQTAAFEACAFGSSCGDRICSDDESAETCADDCVEDACGDGACGADESTADCPADCPARVSVCGDGVCAEDEDDIICPDDCAPDTDEDGVADSTDNCPDAPNPDQADADEDGLGDVCDEEDGRLMRCLAVCARMVGCEPIVTCGMETVDAVQMRCTEGCAGALIEILLAAENFACEEIAEEALDVFDVDCDPMPDDPDDLDNDGRSNASDNCPTDANPEQVDTDSDGVGDACDEDDDGDAIDDDDDNCPLVVNFRQSDLDEDGLGDACDEELRCAGPDSDGDWLCDTVDACPGQAAIFNGFFEGFVYEFEGRGWDGTVVGRGVRNQLYYPAENRPWHWVGLIGDAHVLAHPNAPADALNRAFVRTGAHSAERLAIRTTVRLEAPTDRLSFSMKVASSGQPVVQTVRFLSSFDGAGRVRGDELVFDRLSSGALRLIVGGTTATSNTFAQIDADWRQVGFVFDAGRVTFFVDGRPLGMPVELDIDTVPAQRADWHLVEDVTEATNSNEYLGVGGYDEPVLLHGRALSADQMAQLNRDGVACAMGALTAEWQL